MITGVLILIFWVAFVQGASGTVAGLVSLAGLVERLSAGSHALEVISRSLRVSNRRFKAVSKWSPTVPNARIGWSRLGEESN